MTSYIFTTKYIDSLQNDKIDLPVTLFDYYIELGNKDCEETTSSKDVFETKIFFYAIYDNVLSTKWGSEKKGIADNFMELILWNDNIKAMYHNCGYNYIVSFKKTIKELYEFFDSDKKFCVCNFGPVNHATCLHLTKIDNIIELCYINTGLGIDETYEKFDNFVNLFKITYFEKSKKEDFMHFIMPFIFYNYKDNIDKYIFYYYLYYNDLNIQKHKDYSVFFDLVYNKGYYFDELNNIFKNDVYYIFNKKLYTRSLDTNFVNLWTTKLEYVKKQIPDDNYNVLNYLKLAFETVKFKIHESQIYIEPQQSGSCTYRSILTAWIYNSLITPEKHSERIEKYYNYASNLTIIIPKIIKNNNFIYDDIYLLDLLNKDRIAKYINSENFQIKDIRYNFSEPLTMQNKLVIAKPIGQDKLNTVIEQIRNKTYTGDIYKEFYSDILPYDYRLNGTQCYSLFIQTIITELILVFFLHQYYYNKSEWDTYIGLSLQLYLNTFRFELYNYEEEWISNVIKVCFAYEEDKNFQKKMQLDKYSDISEITNWYYLLIPQNFRHGNQHNGGNSFEQTFIKKFIFNSNNNTVVLKNEINNFDCRYILIDFLKNNYENIYFILAEIKKDELLLNYLIYNLLDFLANNIKYVGENETKKITICLFKLILYLWSNEFYVNNIGHMTIMLQQICVNITLMSNFIYNEVSASFINDNPPNWKFYYIFNNYDPVYYLKNDEYIMFNYDFKKMMLLFKNILVENIDTSIKNLQDYKGNNHEIIYNDLIFKPIILNAGDTNYLLKSLIFENNSYHNQDNKLLLILFNTHEFNTYKQNIMTIKYEGELDRICTLTDEIKINGIKAELQCDGLVYDGSEIKLKYPFLIFSPATSVNFVIKNNDEYKMIIIKRKPNKGDTNILFKEAVFLKNEQKGFYLELSIKKNKLTPIFTNETIETYNEIIKRCNYMYPFSKNKWDFNNFDINVQKEIKIDDELTSCYDNFCKFLGSKLNIQEKLMDIRNYVELKNIDYDTINCTYCNFKEAKKLNKSEIQKSNIYDYIKNNSVCDITLEDKLKENLDKINEFKKNTEKFLNKKYDQIDFSKINNKDYTLINLIHDNFLTFSVILKASLFMDYLNRIIAMITNNTINCHEILEIDNSIINNNNKNILNGITEIILGLNVKDYQWEKIKNILLNYGSEYKKWKIHHFAMGKGKSAVITPILIVIFECNKINVNIVVPTHLIKQTEKTLYDIKYYFNLKFNIYDDEKIKKMHLDNKIDKNAIYLIDEFDFMYNPLQSNFNLIEMQHSVFTNTNDDSHINVNTINKILLKVYKYKEDNTLTDEEEYSLFWEINNILKNSNNYIKNVTYGMSHLDKEKRCCIPYARQDSPLESSSFSSNLITIVLTILYFYENNFILEDNDLYLISKIKNVEMTKLVCDYYGIINYIDLVKHKFFINKSNFFDKKKHNKTDYTEIEKRKNIFKIYIIYIIKTIEETIKIKNSSFFDIINSDVIWQVGYSGTINLNIPQNTIMNYSKEIDKDYDEILGTYFAITGNYTNSKNELYNIISIDDVYGYFSISRLRQCNVLIDACAYLKDIDNVTVAKKLHLISGGKKVIFLLNDDSRKIIIDGNIIPYDETVYNMNEVIYYYSQRHIVGIDFKQPNILNGLVLIDDKNNYTQIAQAIFRMRKLNRGHIANIGYCGKIKDMDKNKLYKNLVKNDEEFLLNTKNLVFLQFLKSSIRKYITKKYEEENLKPMYSVDDKNKLIQDRINLDILNMNDFDNNPQYILLPDNIKKGLKYIVDKFLKFEKTELINLFYDNNNVEININIEMETQIETQIQKSQLLYPKLDFEFRILYNPNAKDDIEIYKICEYTIEDITVIFSINIFTIYPKDELVLCLVKINEKKYLVENIYNINYYYNLLPVYTLDGYLINYNLFKDKNPNQYIDTKLLFNCILKKDTTELIMCDLINTIIDETTKIIQLHDINNFCLLLNHVYNFAKINNTSKNILKLDIKIFITKNYLPINIIEDKYSSYIFNTLLTNLHKTTFTLQQKTPIDIGNYTIKYFAKYNQFFYKILPKFTSNISSYKMKYFKYKNKYLQLKKNKKV